MARKPQPKFGMSNKLDVSEWAHALFRCESCGNRVMVATDSVLHPVPGPTLCPCGAGRWIPCQRLELRSNGTYGT